MPLLAKVQKLLWRYCLVRN